MLTTRSAATTAAILIVLAPGAACGQATAPAEITPASYRGLAGEAVRALDTHEPERAAVLLERLVAYAPDDGDRWLELGAARFALTRYGAAVEAWERALALGFGRGPETIYRIARARALAGDTRAAIDALERALAAGFERRPEIADDPAFASLHGDPRFASAAGILAGKRLGRDDGWRYDLAFLVAEIKRLHYVYRSRPLPAGFDDDARSLDASIPALTDAQITVRLQRLLARLGDGHSVVYFLGGRRALGRLPLRLYLFADGLYVVDAGDELKRLVGRRVVKIGDSDPLESLVRLEPFISRDNAMFVKAIGPYYLLTPDFLRAAGVVADASHVAVTFDDGRGGLETVTLAPSPPTGIVKRLTPSPLPGAPPVPRYLRDPDNPYWFEDVPESDAVYFQFNAVTNKEDEPLGAFALRLRRALDERHARTLVVDVRHNAGGNAELLVPLLRTLVHFETSRPDARLFVIMGRSTFSAAEIFLAQVERLTNAVFVGEPSSSSPTFVGEDTLVVLPYSGTALSISSRYHPADPADDRPWIPPAIPVALTSKDYFANRDPALDEVLRSLGE